MPQIPTAAAMQGCIGHPGSKMLLPCRHLSHPAPLCIMFCCKSWIRDGRDTATLINADCSSSRTDNAMLASEGTWCDANNHQEQQQVECQQVECQQVECQQVDFMPAETAAGTAGIGAEITDREVQTQVSADCLCTRSPPPDGLQPRHDVWSSLGAAAVHCSPPTD
jgi:hypothetical protein